MPSEESDDIRTRQLTGAQPRQTFLPTTYDANEIVPIRSTIGFNVHAEEIMDPPSVFAFYWGREYGSPDSGKNQLATSFDAFYSSILSANRYMDNLLFYGVHSTHFAGSTWVDNAPDNTPTLNSSDVAKLLTGWLDKGWATITPGPDERNYLYVIHFPKEVNLQDQDTFCGYHSWDMYKKSTGKHNLFFAAIKSGAGTDVVSHELVEAFTDRSHNGWYSDDDNDHNPEIGDVCSTCSYGTLQLNGFDLASYWLVAEGRCLQQRDLTFDRAAFTHVAIPSSLQTGQTGQVTLELYNSGTFTWRAIDGYRLVVTPDANHWGVDTIGLPSDVDLGQSVTLSFTITAPTAGGSYYCQWAMSSNRSGIFSTSPGANVFVDTSAQCAALSADRSRLTQKIESLDSSIKNLQEELDKASPAERPRLAERILELQHEKDADQVELDRTVQQGHNLGCTGF